MQSLTCVAHRLVVPALLVGCVLISGWSCPTDLQGDDPQEETSDMTDTETTTTLIDAAA